VPELGAIGAVIDVTPDDAFLATAAMLEELGFDTVWLSGGRLESQHRQVLAVLAATGSARIGTSIIAVDRFDSDAVLALYRRAEASYPGRLIVGLGRAHGPRPLATLGACLDRLAAVPTGSRLLAALGSRMLQLALDRTAGALPVLVTPEYTASVRRVLGEAMLVVEQMVVLESDPVRARAIASGPLRFMATLPAYAQNFRRMGFTDEDIDQLSDGLVDGLVAWGDASAVAARVTAHRAAGADHVALMLLNGAGERTGWASFAHALLEPGATR
jgi:probable F420-dependent oxidoreductase